MPRFPGAYLMTNALGLSTFSDYEVLCYRVEFPIGSESMKEKNKLYPTGKSITFISLLLNNIADFITFD